MLDKRLRREKRKRKREEAHQRRQRLRGGKPDRVENFGALRLSQWGSVVTMENLADSQAHAEHLKELAKKLPEVEREIQDNIDAAIVVVRKYHPLHLLVRSFWQMAAANLGRGPEESNMTTDQLVAVRMIDYLQRLIAAAGPKPEINPPTIDTADYEILRKSIGAVFQMLVPTYFIVRSASLSERDDFDRDLDEFRTRAEMLWATVSGDRYAAHDPRYFREILSPHDEVMQRIFGVSVEQFVQGIVGIRHTLTFGLQELFDDFREFKSDVESALDSDPRGELGNAQSEIDSFVQDHGWSDRREKIARRFFSADLLDVSMATGWPDEFVKALSACPGDDPEFVKTSQKPGWPTRQSITSVKPFIRWQDRSYVFDQAGCMDHLYRGVYAAVIQREPTYRETWNQKQKAVTELLPFDLLAKLLPKCDVFRGVKYRFKTPDGGEDIAECDGIVLFDRSILVVEVKAGAYTSKSPTIHINAHLDSLKELILAPIKQGQRFVQEFRSQSTLELLDKKLQPILGLRNSDFSEISICCVTLDQLSNRAPEIERLRQVQKVTEQESVWAISIDDLRVIADVITNPLIFMDFLSERKKAFRSSLLTMSDELDHLGAYLKHTHYVEYATKILDRFKRTGPVGGWHGYRDPIDQYYHKLLVEDPQCDPPKPNIPPAILEILNILARESRPNRTTAAASLLTLETDAQIQLAKQIDRARAQQALLQRPFPISTRGAGHVTLLLADQNISFDIDDARMHTMAVMQLQHEEDRVLFVLRLENGKLVSVAFEFLTNADITKTDPMRLDEYRYRIAQTRNRKKQADSHGRGANQQRTDLA